MAGVSATYLAREGFTGAPAVTVNDPQVADLWSDLGSRWIIFEQYFKPAPVCRWAQPAVEAAWQLRADYAIDPSAIDRVEVTTFHEAARLATAAPVTTEQAQYSLPFPVAAVLARGRLGAEEITADGLNDPLIASIAGRVVLHEDEEHNRAFPHERYARVTVRMVNGDSVTSVDTKPRGDASEPLADAEIRDKFSTLAGPVLGQARTASIMTSIDRLGRGGELVPLLRELALPH